MKIDSLYRYITGIIKIRGGTDNTIIDNLNSGTGLNAINVAHAGTQYVVSANGQNSTVTQLAANATFTGVVETVFNQQAISVLLTSDKNGTLVLKQYIDAAGTQQTNTNTYTILAGVPFSRALTANGNYFSLTFKNTGTATTTTLSIYTAYGTLPPVSNLGNGPISIDEISGVQSSARPDGFMRVVSDPTSLLFDTFESLNVTDVWTIGGTVNPTGASGILSVSAGTAANATSFAKSQFAFTPASNAYLQYATLVQLEAGAVTGNQRFWGLGVYVTPTVAAPITNGAIFEIDTATGNLLCSVYSNSVRTQSATLVRPTDGATHRYTIYYKASRVYYELDNVIVGTFAFPNPQVSALNTVVGSVNNTGALGTAAVLNSSLIGVADTGKNSNQISDGSFPWRKTKVNADGSLSTIDIAQTKSVYSASITGLLMPAAGTDVFTIIGSATKTVKIIKLAVGGTQTTGSAQDVVILKRSTANTAGISIITTAVPNDSAFAAATAVVRAYAVNPTLGTLVGNLKSFKVVIPNPAGGGNTIPVISPLEIILNVTLRGVAQQLSVNFNGQTMNGNSLDIYIEWTEE